MATGPLRPRALRAGPGPRVSRAAAESMVAILIAPRGNNHRSRLIDLESAAATGQRRIRHEVSMRTKRVLCHCLRVADISAVGMHVPALGLVLKQRNHDLVENLLMNRGVLDRNQGLDAAVEGARHPVGRGDG